mmetsp:Transcript_48239/g.139768  ORF Transcript_48239/g.139768 Transcript_48239/m.139768 type:complete len:169 (+) Transcript_48239:18-524(+)
MHKVQLAVTALGPWVPSMPQAYHTSVMVDDIEFSFCHRGIVSARNWQSHSHLSRGGPHHILDLGSSPLSALQLVKALRPHFKDQTYDLLRKNCNSFSDCALFFLLGRRLEPKYREMERLGVAAERLTGLVKLLSLGSYEPNLKADAFALEGAIEELGSGVGRKSVKMW